MLMMMMMLVVVSQPVIGCCRPCLPACLLDSVISIYCSSGGIAGSESQEGVSLRSRRREGEGQWEQMKEEDQEIREGEGEGEKVAVS